MHDVAEFLHRHPPFERLDEQELEELAAIVEVEYFSAGTMIFRQQDEPMKHVRVVRRGTVELVDEGRVLDLLTEGELFGHPSMLSGQPTGFEARAGEDTLCYRLPAEAVVPLLRTPAGLRYLTRSLLARPRPDRAIPPASADPGLQPAASLIREQPVICEPRCTIREAAGLMSDSGSRAVLVRIEKRLLGILTSGDLRAVVANDISADADVTEVMSSPVVSVDPNTPGSAVVLLMLDRGIRHVPVISSQGEILGVLSDVDLLSAHLQTPFTLRRAIDGAADVDELVEISRRVRPTVVALHGARVAPAQVSATLAIITDALTGRFFGLAVDELGPPPSPLTWLVLGSQGRREPVPSSDIDSAISWRDTDDEPAAKRYARALGSRVVEQLARSGFPADSHGVNAAQPQLEHSADAWGRAIRHSIEHPDEDKALILISLLFDGRSIQALGECPDILDEFHTTRSGETLLRLMLRLALVHRPPTGFLRRVVVEHSGEHEGRLDIKHGGVLAVTGIARHAGLAAGSRSTSTVERLRHAAEAGTLSEVSARTLAEAFDLFTSLRLEHQVQQIQRGEQPDDFLSPDALNPLTRRYLRDAFGEVRAVQKKLNKKLDVEATFG